MKLALPLLALLALAPVAHAETFAFVDTGRIYAESSEAKRVSAEVQDNRDRKQAEIGAAQAAVQKAKDKCAPHGHIYDGAQSLDPPCKPAEELQQKADALAKLDSDEFTKYQADVTGALRKHIAEAAAKLAASKHVTILPLTPLYPVPRRDLTDELIKRLNDSDTAGLAARVAAFEAEKKAAAPPPTKPEHVAKK
jgi:Skp family chaperone for outer membrane proteins